MLKNPPNYAFCRYMKRADVDGVHAMNVACYGASAWDLHRYMSLLVAGPTQRLLVYEDGVGGPVLGFAAADFNRDRVLIQDLFTDPGHRRLQLGKALLGRVLGLAGQVRKKVPVEFLLRAGNAAGEGLLRRFGFAAAGVQRGAFVLTGEDGFLFRRDMTVPYNQPVLR